MVKAIVSHGQIRPLEPLPTDWLEGKSVRIVPTDESDTSIEAIDRDFMLLEQLCITNNTNNEQLLDQALQQAKQQAKEQVRRQMGLS